jgi:hypothetical protein
MSPMGSCLAFQMCTSKVHNHSCRCKEAVMDATCQGSLTHRDYWGRHVGLAVDGQICPTGSVQSTRRMAVVSFVWFFPSLQHDCPQPLARPTLLRTRVGGGDLREMQNLIQVNCPLRLSMGMARRFDLPPMILLRCYRSGQLSRLSHSQDMFLLQNPLLRHEL